MARSKEISTAKTKFFQPNYSKILNRTDKRFGLTVETYSGNRLDQSISSGLLCVDLILGNGGWLPGWHTIFGPEQGAKSTLSALGMHQAFKADIPVIQVWEYEKSFDPNYVRSFWDTNLPEFVFGRKRKSGLWEIEPRIRPYDEHTAEPFFDSLHMTLKNIPRKRKIHDQWYYIYDDTKENRGDLGNFVDKTLSKQMGKLCVPALDGRPQGFVWLDSYTAMLPENMDEEDNNNSIGKQARMFSENIKRVKGLITSRNVILNGVNQLRTNPMARYGCFQFETLIELADGSSQMIGQIAKRVDAGEEIWLRSYDIKKHIFVKKRVLRAFRNGKAERNEFLRVTTDNNRRMLVTPNHLVLNYETHRMVPVSSLRVGSVLMTHRKYRPFNADQKQFILGSLLGDGSINSCTDKRAVQFQFNHGNKQLPYLRWKHQLFGVYTRNRTIRPNGELCHIFSTRRIFDPYLVKMNEEYRLDLGFRSYSGLPEEIFRSLDARGIAVWFMDDGSYGGKYCKPFFNVKRLPRDVCARLCRLLEKVLHIPFLYLEGEGIKVKNPHDTQKFFDAIGPYMHPMFRYKVEVPGDNKMKIKDDYFSYTWNNQVGKSRRVACPTEVIAIEQYQIRARGQSHTKFDLEIEDTHTYIAAGCVVHNSPEYETSGQALRFFSDIRLKQSGCAVPSEYSNIGIKEKGNHISEDAYLSPDSEGSDLYRYLTVDVEKNKMGGAPKGTRIHQRIWVSDETGTARGFDPVFDVFQYLILTGQAKGNLKSFQIKMKDNPLYKRELSIIDLKGLIVGNVDAQKEVCKKLKVDRNPKLLEACRQQIRNGSAYRMFKGESVEE